MTDPLRRMEAHEAAREVAHLSREMFNAFLAEGFTEKQALALVHTWLGAQSQPQQPT